MRNNYRLESRMRENRPCGSEGGEGVSPFRPLSSSIEQLMTANSLAASLRHKGGFQTRPYQASRPRCASSLGFAGRLRCPFGEGLSRAVPDPSKNPAPHPRQAQKCRFHRPLCLDFPVSRRYIAPTFRQAVSFACSERRAQAAKSLRLLAVSCRGEGPQSLDE